MVKRLALTLICAAMGACLDVAEQRARLDERIGNAEISGLSVRVSRGAAAVRNLTPDSLQLWATAPSLELNVRTEAARSFRVRLQNAMPDGVLTASNSDVQETKRDAATDVSYSLDLPEGVTTLRFSTPDAEDSASFRFGAFADVQEAIDSVQDIYRRMNETPGLRFVVMSGDLTQRGTVAQLERFQRELRGLQVPCFSTLGNHELGDADDNYQRWFGRGNYHFTFKSAHFTLLDDASATIAPRVYDWLDGWLHDGRDSFHSVYMHLPPLDSNGLRNGAMASRAEADLLLSKLARSAVDLTIYGHVHTYDAYTNAGIPAFITGGGGAIPERFDHVGRHFLVIDVDPASQQFQTAIVHVD